MTEPPLEPFSPPESPVRRRVASRIVPAEVATIGIVVLVALALVVYFALK